jgi:hypothetical protein
MRNKHPEADAEIHCVVFGAQMTEEPRSPHVNDGQWSKRCDECGITFTRPDDYWAHMADKHRKVRYLGDFRSEMTLGAKTTI